MQRRNDFGYLNNGGDDDGVDVYVNVAHIRLRPDRIPCNGAVKRIPGGIISTGGLESEGVWDIWSRR